jgi:cell division protease FtsH
LVLIALAVGFGMWLFRPASPAQTAPQITYTAFRGLVTDDAVTEVTLRGNRVIGTLSREQDLKGQSTKTFASRLPSQNDDTVQLLREHGVDVDVQPPEEGGFGENLLMGLLPWILILGFWWWMSRRAQQTLGGAGGGPLGRIMKGRAKRFDAERAVSVRFDDVAGLQGPKRDLEEIVSFLKDPGRFASVGAEVPRGVLLAGPPGTGKTLLARAVAGEAGVPFWSVSGSDFIEMFVGVGAARVRDIFESCKKEAPSILFIDEIDAVGRSRGTGLGGGHDEREQTLNQLLNEMDGFDPRDRVVVMAASNRPDVLDKALLRPGRFDRQLAIDLPPVDARRAILGVHTRKKPLADDVDLDTIARSTPGMSGADLANLTNEAALAAARDGRNVIQQRDFDQALDKIVLGDERELTLSLPDRRRIAIHEAGHTMVAHATKPGPPPHRVSIIPRGMSLGATQQVPEADQYVVAEPALRAKLAVLMGGYAAEHIVYGHGSTGAEDDLRKASRLAKRMVASYGMSEAIGPVHHEIDDEHPFLGRQVATSNGASDATSHIIEREIKQTLEAALHQATSAVERERETFDELVDQLLEHETLESEALEMILGPRESGDREPRSQWASSDRP